MAALKALCPGPVSAWPGECCGGVKSIQLPLLLTISATADTSVKVALSQTVQRTETVNQLAERVSNALDIQNYLNGHIQLGILTLNQQVALVQEQVDYLWTFQQLIMLCVLFMALYCMLLLLLWNSTDI